MYNIGICDDEKSTCTEIENIIEEYKLINNLQIEIDIWYSGESLSEYLMKDNKYDLLFIDIELIKMNGMHVGSLIRSGLNDYRTLIVYISSKSNYAMHLFNTQPFDFFVKPISENQIVEVLHKAFKIWQNSDLLFSFYFGAKHYKILLTEIIYFSSMDKKIYIYTLKNTYIFYGKLRNIILELPNNFILIHQSSIINQNYISECTYETIKMVNGDILSISKRYRSNVRNKIKENKRRYDI